MNKKLLLPIFLLFAFVTKAQQKVVQLYNGAAPGSESWTWNQSESADNVYHSNVVYNVSHPTLTVYLPDSTVANTGTAVIICPGGGLQTLSINHEGYDVGKWLQKHGITAFLLEYRLMHTLGPDPYKEMLAKMKANTVLQEQAPVAPLAVADGRATIAYVRSHAAEYGISPDRIGIIGFSAGGPLPRQQRMPILRKTDLILLPRYMHISHPRCRLMCLQMHRQCFWQQPAMTDHLYTAHSFIIPG
jgi:acetyl esterase/lipase